MELPVVLRHSLVMCPEFLQLLHWSHFAGHLYLCYSWAVWLFAESTVIGIPVVCFFWGDRLLLYNFCLGSSIVSLSWANACGVVAFILRTSVEYFHHHVDGQFLFAYKFVTDFL